MDYSLKLSLLGGTQLRPLAARMVCEMGELREGPGEDEIRAMAAAVEPLVATLLKNLEQQSSTQPLELEMETDEVRMVFQLTVAGSAGADLLGDEAETLLAAAGKAFDEVEGPTSESGAAFHLVLTRHIPC